MADDGVQRYCPRCGDETDAAYCPNDGTATVLPDIQGVENPATFAPGTIVEGRYRITESIGRGGFGAVFRAEHTGTGQDIALKVMLADSGDVDRSVVRRFYKEAQVTAKLRHPNTVRVFDVGQTGSGALYIAMEFLRGPTLEELLRDLGAQGTAMTQRQALDVAIPVLRSLNEAHAMELVHRDLKPANIMLSEVLDDDPVVKVLDFGIARTSDSSLTGAGTALGTPAYMSPEQCLGRNVDGRSDIYALGVILYRCMAGRVPFDDRNPLTIMYKHAHEVPADLASVAKSEVSAGLSTCVMRALEKKADDRFATAKDMRAALEAVRDGSWRAVMDGEDADATTLLSKSVARAEPSSPPGDTLLYSGDQMDETASMDLLDAETSHPSEQFDVSARTVAYSDVANETNANDTSTNDADTGDADSGDTDADAPPIDHAATGRLKATPDAGAVDQLDGAAPRASPSKKRLAVAVAASIAVLAGAAVMWLGGENESDKAGSNARIEADSSGQAAGPPDDPPDNPPADPHDAKTAVSADTAELPGDTGQPDAGASHDRAQHRDLSSTDVIDSPSAMRKSRKARASRTARKSRKSKRARDRKKTATATPPRPPPKIKPKAKPKAARPVALD